MSVSWTARPLEPGDQSFLWEMLDIALWDAPDEPRRPRSVLDNPRISRLVEHWGRPDDFGLAAVDPATDTDIGAVWTRLDGFDQLEAFGCSFPCIGIAVIEAYRNKGVGTFLMSEIISALEGRVDGLRLGVHPKNKNARRLYEKFGFMEYAIGHGNYSQMKLEFGSANGSSQ